MVARWSVGYLAGPVRGVIAHSVSPDEFPRAIRRGLREGLGGIGGDLPAMDGIVEIAAEKGTERSRTHPFEQVVRQKMGVFAIFPGGADKLFG
jgi:hypothetical protein